MTLINNFTVKDSINLLQTIIDYYRRTNSVSKLILDYDAFLSRKFSDTLAVTEARSFINEEVILTVGWQDNAPCFWKSLLLTLNSGVFKDVQYLNFFHQRLKRLLIKNNHSHEMDREILGYSDIYSEDFKFKLKFENVEYGIDDMVIVINNESHNEDITMSLTDGINHVTNLIEVTKEGEELTFNFDNNYTISLSETKEISIVIGGAVIQLWNKESSYNLLHDALNSWLEINENEDGIENPLIANDFTLGELKSIADRVKQENDYQVKSLFSFWSNNLTLHTDVYDNDEYILAKTRNSIQQLNIKENIISKFREAIIQVLPTTQFTRVSEYISLLSELLINKNNSFISVLAFSHSFRNILGFTVLPKKFNVFTNSYELLRVMLNDIYARAQYSKYIFVGDLSTSKIQLVNEDNEASIEFLNKRKDDLHHD